MSAACPRSLTSLSGPKFKLLQYLRSAIDGISSIRAVRLKNQALFGNIYKESFGKSNIVQLFNPEDYGTVCRNEGRHPMRPTFPIFETAYRRKVISTGLGWTNGREWYELRHKISPIMVNPKSAYAHAPCVTDVVKDFSEKIRVISSSNHCWMEDFAPEAERYALECMFSIIMGRKLGMFDDMKGSAGKSEANVFIQMTKELFDLTSEGFWGTPWFQYMKTPMYKRWVALYEGCTRIINKYINQALKEGSVPESTMLAKFLEQGIPINEIQDICMDLFGASVVSTSGSLSLLIHNLAIHPQAQARLREELESVCGSLSTDLTLGHLKKMQYLKACIKESFRIYYPVDGFTRISTQEMALAGYEVPAGTILSTNNPINCLDEKYFESPSQFKPERWLGRTGAGRQHPFVFLPFGHGPRMCPGRRFAELELQVAAAELVKNFVITAPEAAPVGTVTRIFTVPNRKVSFHFNPLSNQSTRLCRQDEPGTKLMRG